MRKADLGRNVVDSTKVKDASLRAPDFAAGQLPAGQYSTPQVVYDEIIPAFKETSAGEGVDVRSSFGASGDQSRAVEAGQRADVVSFSIEPDVTRLVESDVVAPDWDQGPNDGLVTRSVVAFIVRKGNPKNIRDRRPAEAGRLCPHAEPAREEQWNGIRR